jgi:methyl-accepting chemotaxis protein
MSKELVWVSKELLEKVKDLDAVFQDHEKVKSIIESFKDEVEQFTYDVEDSVSIFRRQSEKIKSSFKEVVDKEIESLQGFWEEQERRRAELTRKLAEIRESVRSVSEEIQTVKKELGKLNVYGLDKLIEVIDKINQMSEQEKEVLHYVFSFGKRQ